MDLQYRKIRCLQEGLKKIMELSTIIATGEFILLIILTLLYYFFHYLPERKKTGDKVRKKIDDPRLKKLTFEEKVKLGIVITKTSFEFSDDSKKVEEVEKKLEVKIEQIGILKGERKESLNTLQQFNEGGDKAINVAKDGKETVDTTFKIANDSIELVKKCHKNYEELGSLYLENKEKHRKSSKEFIESMIDLLFIYQEIARCPKCGNILEFLIRNNGRKFKVKKLANELKKVK